MTRRSRVIVSALLVALLAALFMGVRVAQMRMVQWLAQVHRFGPWELSTRQLRWASLQEWHAGSVRLTGPAATVQIDSLTIRWKWSSIPTLAPILASVEASSVEVRPHPTPSSGKPPSFPKDLKLPLGLDIRVRRLRVYPQIPGDSAERPMIGLEEVTVHSNQSRGASLALSKFDLQGWSGSGNLALELDWKTADSLQLAGSSSIQPGCCTRDSVWISASLGKTDLTRGQATARIFLEDLIAWHQTLPVLAKIPQFEALRLEIQATRRHDQPEIVAKIQGNSAPWVMLPRLGWSGEIFLDSLSARLRLAGLSRQGSVQAEFSTPQSPLRTLARTRAKGLLHVRGLGWTLGSHNLPLGLDAVVDRLDSRGAAANIRTVSGSVFKGDGQWKGLHWNLDALVAPNEPWTVVWLDSLRMEGGHVVGHDSAQGSAFRVATGKSNWRGVEADSLVSQLWLNTKRVELPWIALHRDSTVWDVEGDVDWSQKTWHFGGGLRSDSLPSSIEAGGVFGSDVEVSAWHVPLERLPHVLAATKVPFPVRLSAHLLHRPLGMERSAQWLSASLKGKPTTDSLVVSLEASRLDSVFRVDALRIDLGGSQIKGSSRIEHPKSGWRLDTLGLELTDVDLSRIRGVWPGIPLLVGKLNGQIASSRTSGLGGLVHLQGGGIGGADGKMTLVPDLQLWAEKDTLHLGGIWKNGQERIPFELHSSSLFSQNPVFGLSAYAGDVLRLRGQGRLAMRQKLSMDLMLDGGGTIPGWSTAKLSDLSVVGRVEGQSSPSGYIWSAQVHGDRGTFEPLAGNSLDLRFGAHADQTQVRLDSLVMRQSDGGIFKATGRKPLPTGALELSGNARGFHISLDPTRSLRMEKLDVSSGLDGRIHLALADASYHQSWKAKENLDVGVPMAKLTLVQAKDWRKLEGQVVVDRLRFTRNFADPTRLMNSVLGLGQSKAGPSGGSGSSIPLLLDVQVSSSGDSLGINNNLATSQLAFDVRATGPSKAPVLTGSVDAPGDNGSFGYGRKRFGLDQFRLEWSAVPAGRGTYQLEGSHPVRSSCDQVSNRDFASQNTCTIKFSSSGTLQEPHILPLTSNCGNGLADGSEVTRVTQALFLDCFPLPTDPNRPSTTSDSAGVGWQQAGRDALMGVLMDQFNEWINKQRLEGRRRRLSFLPDTLVLTDVPSGGSRNDLGLLTTYHISSRLDLDGEYRRSLDPATTTGTANSGVAQSLDDQILRLRLRLPFQWLQAAVAGDKPLDPTDSVRRARETEELKLRLENRVELILEVKRSLYDGAQTETVIQPALRYRWEFW